MASTYSSKLRLELIGAGEQAGLWGTTTNKNIGQLLEQAIAGVTTVDLSASGGGNYTLTALDGAPDESRSAVVKCIGTASAAVNLIIPTQTKLYVVRNDCGKNLYVKTAAQSGGVELENGEATLVFCDGTNAILGLETVAAGTLNVAGGGTGRTTSDAYAVICGGTTNTAAQQSVSGLGTSGQVLTSNGASALPTWQSITTPSAFPTGTVMLFAQTAAPTGWTKSTTHDNKALRVVSGTASSGGTVAFTTAFASSRSVTVSSTTADGSVSLSGSVGSTTLSTSQIPSHSHQIFNYAGVILQAGAQSVNQVTGVTLSGLEGGGGSHTHSFSGSGAFTGTPHTHTSSVDLAVQYVDVILATKN